jgi:hypothetical protein
MRLALALLLAAACSNPSKPPVTNGSGSGSGSAVVGDSKPAEVAVGDSAGLVAAKDQAARVTGKAGNAKLGAVVMLPDRTPVYCMPLESWPSDVDGNQVTAHGKLEQSSEFMARGDGAGTGGPVWVLRDCTYDPVR